MIEVVLVRTRLAAEVERPRQLAEVLGGRDRVFRHMLLALGADMQLEVHLLLVFNHVCTPFLTVPTDRHVHSAAG